MKYLEKLLEGVEVEWKTLKDVYKFQYGKGNTIPQKGGKYPVYGSNGIVGTHDEYNSEDSPVIGHIGAYAGIVNWGKGKHFVTYNGVICNIINDLVNPKYAYYYLLKQDFNAIAKSASHPFVSYEDLNKVEIPIPPLSVQKEIVRILDIFSALAAQLAAQLANCKKQYAFYREELLTFGEDVEWKTLEEVAIKISSGGTPSTTNAKYYGGDIPWLRTQEVDFVDVWNTEIKITDLGLKNSSAKMIPANCVIVAMYGATVGKIGINKIPLCTNQACANIQVNEDIANYRYIFHYLSSKYEHIKSLGSGSQTNINARIVKNYPIPIPPLAEQERIVNILDKFDTLTTSMSEGLPREIKLREKQYEYYRDLLLTFPKDN